LFDFTDGWGGRHSMDIAGVVVTHQPPADWIAAHPDASFEFVTEGVEAAVGRALEIAGDRNVAVTAGTIARQCLELGLLDEVAIDLVPVVFGGGRPYFGDLVPGDLPLGDPTTCIPSDRVIHLVYPVRQSSDRV
jgi:dihydrofolate reductase